MKQTILQGKIKLVMVAFFCSIISCKKETRETEQPELTHHYKVDASMYPYLFDSGSYWVYVDTANGVIDSTKLIISNRGSYTIPQAGPNMTYSPGDVEIFRMEYFSSFSNSIYVEECWACIITRGLFGGNGSRGNVFLSTKQIGYKGANAEIVDVIDSMVIENNLYRNVTKMEIDSDSCIPGNYNFYYADNVGLIRKESIVNDSISQVWNLLRYDVILYPY